MDAGAELGQYRVEARLGSTERAYLSATSKDDVAVCLVELQGDEVETYTAAAARKTEHAHLARVFEVFSHEGTPLLVFEHVPGVTLTERLAEIGKKSEVEAVGAALRVSDALSTLHDAGGVHGFIHTDSVVVEPPERLGPVLTFAPIPSDERTFHSPERGETGKPSVADDAWAAAGLLFMMLTGAAPPKEGYANVEELEGAGVAHPALREALLHGLNRNPEQRSTDIRPLKRELARWFVEHAGDEAVLLGPHSTLPPPLPAGMRAQREPAAVVSAVTPAAPARRPRFAMLAVMGTLLGLGGAWAISALRPKPAPVVAVAAPTQAAPPESAKAIDLSEVPVTGEDQKQAIELDKISSCVANYLPKGAFGKSPDLGWLCTEADPNKGAQSLRVAVVGSAPKGTLTDAMKLAARLGWYDMAAYAVVRAGCCEDPKPLAAPEPGKGCDPVVDALQEIAKAVIAGRSYDDAFKKYTGAIHCELNQGRTPFGRAQRPQNGEDTAFKEFVDAIAH